MQAYIWRHNKTYHSHSMIDEPCVNNEFYVDALAVVAADSVEEALLILAKQNRGWRIEDLRELCCSVVDLDKSGVIFTELRGGINHL